VARKPENPHSWTRHYPPVRIWNREMGDSLMIPNDGIRISEFLPEILAYHRDRDPQALDLSKIYVTIIVTIRDLV
jgi:hypothetical protein